MQNAPQINAGGLSVAFLPNWARESAQKCGGRRPTKFEGLPGPPGPARPPKRTQTNPARLPSSTRKKTDRPMVPEKTQTSLSMTFWVLSGREAAGTGSGNHTTNLLKTLSNPL